MDVRAVLSIALVPLRIAAGYGGLIALFWNLEGIPRIGIGEPLRVVLLVPVASLVWALCALTPAHAVRLRGVRAHLVALAAASAFVLLYDRHADLDYVRPGRAREPLPTCGTSILGDAPHYQHYLYRHCGVSREDVLFGALLLAPLAAFLLHRGPRRA